MNDTCWMVWHRNCLHATGQWFAWNGTAAYTRRDCLDKCINGHFGGINNTTQWNNMRRRGLVKCCQTVLIGAGEIS